jgi:hypothetical protein
LDGEIETKLEDEQNGQESTISELVQQWKTEGQKGTW